MACSGAFLQSVMSGGTERIVLGQESYRRSACPIEL